MTSLTESTIHLAVANLARELGVKLYRPMVRIMPDGTKAQLLSDKNGLRGGPHKNTWKRKRVTAWLVCVEYYVEGEPVMRHVEPAAVFPSDILIAKLALLPAEVRK